MRQSGYMAKTDHLRRMREQTQHAMEKMRQSWQRTSLLTLIGSTIWYLAIASQLLWHGFGTLGYLEEGVVGETPNIQQCFISAATSYQVNSGCAKAMYSPAGWMIILSFLTIWWNPVMRRRWIDRAVGLSEFYKLQLILLFVRTGGWYVLGVDMETGFEHNVTKAIHSVMLAFNLVVSNSPSGLLRFADLTKIPFIAYRKVYIAQSPRVTFQETYEPLVPLRQRTTAAQSTSQQAIPPSSRSSTSSTRHHRYRYERPPSPAAKPFPPAYHPPTPPPEEGYDEMDIDPPKKTHNLRPSIHRPEEPTWKGPSPFYGKIPAAPVSMEHQLRNPPNKPSFQKTSPERQELFFQSMTKGRSALSAVNGVESNSHSTEIEMRPPQFFTEKDRADQETGLESWFSDVFSLGDAAAGARKASGIDNDGSVMEASETRELWYSISCILGLVLAAYCWTVAYFYPSLSVPLYFAAVGVAAIVSGTRLHLIFSSDIINHSDLLLCLLEFFGSAAIGYRIQQARLADFPIHEELGSFPLWYFGFMIFQESSVFVTAYRQREQLRKMKARKEYIVRQEHPQRGKEPSPPREQKSLPVERSFAPLSQRIPQSSALSRPRQHQTPGRTGFLQDHPNTFEEHVARTQAQYANASPGSKGMSGLSLGFDDAPPTQRRSARLRGHAVNPWQVGGL